jgi:hypothetical protein
MPRGFYLRHFIGLWLIVAAIGIPGGPSLLHGLVFLAGLGAIVSGVVSAVRSGALGHRGSRWGRDARHSGPASYGDFGGGHGGGHHGGDAGGALGGFTGGDFGGGGGDGGGGHHGG